MLNRLLALLAITTTITISTTTTSIAEGYVYVPIDECNTFVYYVLPDGSLLDSRTRIDGICPEYKPGDKAYDPPFQPDDITDPHNPDPNLWSDNGATVPEQYAPVNGEAIYSDWTPWSPDQGPSNQKQITQTRTRTCVITEPLRGGVDATCSGLVAETRIVDNPNYVAPVVEPIEEEEDNTYNILPDPNAPVGSPPDGSPADTLVRTNCRLEHRRVGDRVKEVEICETGYWRWQR